MKNPFHLLHLNIFVGLAALSLSGCMADEMASEDYRFSPVQASERYPIKQVKGLQAFAFSSRLGHLSTNQTNVLRSLARNARTARSDITISRPNAGGKSERVAGAIVNLLVAQGIDFRSLRFTGYAGPASGPVHLSYSATRLVTKPCGDWSKDLSETQDNGPYPNLGCAVQANIAAEIANPDAFGNPVEADMAPAGQGVLAVNNAMKNVSQVTMPTNYSYVN